MVFLLRHAPDMMHTFGNVTKAMDSAVGGVMRHSCAHRNGSDIGLFSKHADACKGNT